MIDINRAARYGAMALFVLVFSVTGLAPASAVIPLEAFARLPNLRDVELSPDGTHVAAVQVYEGEKVLAVYSLEGKKPKVVSIVKPSEMKDVVQEIRNFYWVNDDRLLVKIEAPGTFESRRGRIGIIDTRMISFNRDGSDITVVPKADAVDGWRGNLGSIIDTLPDDPKRVLIAFKNDAYKMDVYNGRVSQVVNGTYRSGWYMTDLNSEVRIRYDGKKNENDSVALHRNPGSINWNRLFTKEQEEADFSSISFSEDPNILFVQKTNEDGWEEVYEYDIAKQKVGERIFVGKGVEFRGILYDFYNNKLLGISYAKHYPRHIFFDAVYANVAATIKTALPEMRNYIVNSDKMRNKFVISSSNTIDPTTYYIFDRTKNTLVPLGSAYPELEGKQLSSMKAISYPTRDGININAYLTLPPGTQSHPTVILPHGGPTARDYWVFDDWAQFLASRGYAVLQPNYRGSSGLGEKFEKAGYGRWGLEMQDDLTDGTQYLIEQGIADPGRICIVGWSYGGYAALSGIIKEPSLYKCAVSGGGVSDIRDQIEFWGDHGWEVRDMPHVGNYFSDGRKLKDNSPINNVDAIRVPVLLLHGEYDRRVPISQSKRMAKKLEKTGYLYKYIELEQGDHHLSLEKNRMIFFRELETFLAQNLK